MKLANRIITIVVAAFATAFISSFIITLIIFGPSMEVLAIVFLVDLIFVLFLGSPIALGINQLFRQSTFKNIAFKLLLHIVAAVAVVSLFLLVIGEKQEIFSDESFAFYIAAIVNSVVYLFILSLLKLTGSTSL